MCVCNSLAVSPVERGHSVMVAIRHRALESSCKAAVRTPPDRRWSTAMCEGGYARMAYTSHTLSICLISAS